MDFQLSEELTAVRDLARDFAEKEVAPVAEHADTRHRDEGGLRLPDGVSILDPRAVAERHGLTTMQLACQWNLAHPAVECVVPTLIQEAGESARPIEEKRAELASLPDEGRLGPDQVDEIRSIGDNTGCMALKGATPDHTGEERPDRWSVSAELAAVASDWGIDPERDLRYLTAEAAR